MYSYEKSGLALAAGGERVNWLCLPYFLFFFFPALLSKIMVWPPKIYVSIIVIVTKGSVANNLTDDKKSND